MNNKRRPSNRQRGSAVELDLTNLRNSQNGQKFTRRSRSIKNEHHLLARAQFIVSGGSDISSNVKDVDKPVNWSNVLQIRKYVHSVDLCPICLCEPQLAQIVRCGHVYCMVCLKEMYSYFDGEYGSCPVCNEYIKRNDSKIIKYILLHKYNIGDVIDMRLMKRLRSCVLCSPASFTVSTESLPVLEEDNSPSPHSRIVTVNSHSMANRLIFKPFMAQMETKIPNYDDDQSLLIVEGISLLESNINNIKLSCDVLSFDLRKDCDDDYVFFYQSCDGQNIFLHSFNIKCLLNDHSSLENCPHILRGTIIAIETFIITDDNRAMWKFLSHLPLSSKFTFVEVDLSSVLSERSSMNNKVEMEKRAQCRRNKEMREEKEMEMSKLKAERRQDFFMPYTELEVHDLSDTSLFPILCESVDRPKVPQNRMTYAQAVGNPPEVSNDTSLLYEMCITAKKKNKHKK